MRTVQWVEKLISLSVNNFMETFTKIECCNCGVIWGVSPQLQQNWRRTKNIFFCPNGHSQSYTESTADILRKRIIDKDIKINNLEIENSRLLKFKTKKCKNTK